MILLLFLNTYFLAFVHVYFFFVKTVPVWIFNDLIIAFEFDSSSSVDQKYTSIINYIYENI